MAENITPHEYKTTQEDRAKLMGHKPMLLWFTGLSGSGKSTIANVVEQRLHSQGIKTYVLDGDNIRNGINKNLSFSQEDREENNRRVGEVAKLMVDAGLVVLAAFVSPYKKGRDNIRKMLNDANFVEIFVNASLEECEKRDVKGLYEKARKGEIKNMTGISDPYEAPENPEIEIVTDKMTVEESVQKILDYVRPLLKRT
ncbi:MAG: adenylyl-sulfate kinase [Flavobacteriaceae bacterium]|nr:adenylyl-sulfate kinase [Flavobacteriaceae bacterium]